MKKIFSILLVLPIILNAQSEINWDDWDVIPGKILVKFDSIAGKQHRESTNENFHGVELKPIGYEIKEQFTKNFPDREYKSLLPNTFVGTFDPVCRDSILEKLRNEPSIIYFEPDRIRIVSGAWGTATPNDYNPTDLWGMERIGAPVAWAKQSSARQNINVVISEPGNPQTTHQDLVNQYSGTLLLNPESNDPDDVDEVNNNRDHAMHVAGTIAATGNNGIGVVGVANVNLIASGTNNTSSNFADHVEAWANAGARLVNMSWGYCGSLGCGECSYASPSQTEQDAINGAANQIVFVAAAGNDGCETDANGRMPTPASYDNVLAVSNLRRISITNPDGSVSFNYILNNTCNPGSNFGSYVDFTAPGTDINSTIQNNGYSGPNWCGTSMAAPHVTGSIAAVLAIQPNFGGTLFRPTSLIRLFRLTAEDLGASGKDDSFGYGLIRVDRAVNSIADIYADQSGTDIAPPFGIGLGFGSLAQPFHSMDFSLNLLQPQQTLGLVAGMYPETFTGNNVIDKPCKIISVGGAAIIGQ